MAGGRAWLRKGREITRDEDSLFFMALFPPYLELGAFVVTEQTARHEYICIYIYVYLHIHTYIQHI